MRIRFLPSLGLFAILLGTSAVAIAQTPKPFNPSRPRDYGWWKNPTKPAWDKLPSLTPSPQPAWKGYVPEPKPPLRPEYFRPPSLEVPEAAKLHLSPAGVAELKRYVALLTGRRSQPSVRTDPAVEAIVRDKGRYPVETAKLLSPSVRKSFPNLGDHFEVLGPSTKRYNCIAWSVRTTKRWVWPGKSVAAFDQLYGRYGYRRLRTMDYRVVPGMQKIVLYGKIKSDGGIECIHGARQAPNGTWTSKLGQMARIRHQTPEALTGPSYGRPIAVYVRAKPAKRSRLGSDLVRR